jgi:hypothetical protein
MKQKRAPNRAEVLAIRYTAGVSHRACPTCVREDRPTSLDELGRFVASSSFIPKSIPHPSLPRPDKQRVDTIGIKRRMIRLGHNGSDQLIAVSMALVALGKDEMEAGTMVQRSLRTIEAARGPRASIRSDQAVGIRKPAVLTTPPEKRQCC